MSNQKIWTEIEKVIDSFISSDWIDEVKLNKELKGHFKARFCPEEKREKLWEIIQNARHEWNSGVTYGLDDHVAQAVLTKILEVVDEVRIELLTTSTSLINKDVLKAKLKELVD